MKKIFGVLLSSLIVFTCSTAAHATTVDIVCLMDSSYRSEYVYSDINMSATMANVEYPFNNKWDITFDETYLNINDLFIDSCPLTYGTACTTTSCGNTCVNASVSDNHHKNIYQNFNYIAGWVAPPLGYDLVLTASASNMCYQDENGYHSSGILGLGYVSAGCALVKNNTTRGMCLNVRVIQHELSHNYGCVDNACSSNSSCIMSGGFDNNCIYDLSTIWCNNCTNTFNAALY